MPDSVRDGLRWRGRAAAAILTVALLLPARGAWAQGSPGAPPPATAAAPALTATDLAEFMDGFVPYAMHSADLAGATVSVVANGQIIFAKGYGLADLRQAKPVLPDRTLFRVASISKLFTWTAVMQLVQAGKLDLDRDVNDYLDFKVPEKLGPITLRNLMTHTAGFEETFAEGTAKSSSDILPLREYLARHVPPQIFPPGKIVAYSNYGATLAGYIVQRVSGEPFDEYIAGHILQPLGMTHSTFDQPPPPALASDLSRGYLKASDDKPVPFVYSNIAPAGALCSTAVDMAHFMIAQLEGGSYNGASIMSPATAQLMHTPQSRMAPGMNGFDLGFYQDDRNGLRIIGHGGDLLDFHSDLHLLLDKDVGLFVAFNTEGKDFAADTIRTALLRAFLDRYYPYTPPVEPTLPHSQADAARVAGWYIPSIQWQSSGIRVVEGLEQVRVIALPSGEIEMSPLLKNIAGAPEHWREVGPLTYREVGGQEHLKFVTDADGHVAYWISDHLIPVAVYLKVHGLEQNGEVTWMGTVCLAVLVLTVAIWIGGAMLRRRFKTPLRATLQEKRLRLASRVGILLMLAIVCAWQYFFAVVNDIKGGMNGLLTVVYLVGLLGLLGALAVLTEAVRRALRGPGGWLVRSGEVLLGLCALYGIWFILFFGLANFSYQY
ncbi:MAG TPA: serine hydrolase domain-containing protein [Steroidobacteraceae bacterium]|nr:serine hydrolase domain-containing protein [Steroidobacteraceae bacterium]